MHNFCFGLTSPLVQLFRNEITEVVPHFGGKTRVGTLSLIVHTCRFLRADSLVPPERASAVRAMNHIELRVFTTRQKTFTTGAPACCTPDTVVGSNNLAKSENQYVHRCETLRGGNSARGRQRDYLSVSAARRSADTDTYTSSKLRHLAAPRGASADVGDSGCRLSRGSGRLPCASKRCSS